MKKPGKRSAVSPVIATLILIIIVVVGSVTVAVIMSNVGGQTSKQVGAQNVASNAQARISVAGSTYMYSAVSSLASSFQNSQGVSVSLSDQGGNAAGMEAVATNIVTIGMSSSYSVVVDAIEQYPLANLQAFEVGGTAVVVISNGLADAAPTPNPCYVLTLGALQKIFTYGTFYVTPNACEFDNTLTASGIINTPTLAKQNNAGPYIAVSRSDLPSEAEDIFCSYLGATICSSVTNNQVTLPGHAAAGDSGVLSYVQSNNKTIGFVDLGYAEGLTSGRETAQKVTINELNSTSAADTSPMTPAAPCASSGAFNCYALSGSTTTSLHNYVNESLSGTLGGIMYPDVQISDGVNGLTTTFWFVTAGPPTVQAQEFINYVQSPSRATVWNSFGFFSLYQLTQITPP